MFEPKQPILLAELQVHFTIDGRLVSAPAKVFERLQPRPQVVFEVSNVPRDPQSLSQSTSGPPQQTVSTFPLMSEGPSTLKLDSGMRVRVVPTPWLVLKRDAELYLEETPTVVLNSGKPIVSLQYYVVNITGDLFRQPLTLQAPPWLVRIYPVPELWELERTLRSDEGFAVTHNGTIQRSDGKGFPEDDAQSFLRGLEQFLSFVCGTQCAITNVVGFDAEGHEVWKRWGSYHVSPWQRHRTWSDVTIRGAVPKIFGHYWEIYHTTSERLHRILRWYVASNELETADTSIILNQVVLESFTTWKASNNGREGKVGILIANMLRKQGINPQIPDSCTGLIALAKKNSFEHGPHALVEIRNSIVHANPKLQLDSIDVYHEAKQLGLWYVELLLLRRFKYTGEYASRLTDVQRAGATEPVPWAKGAQL